MQFDLDETITLGGVAMTLRTAVAKVQEIPSSYRSLATIFRKGQPGILDIEAIDAIAESAVFSKAE